MDYKLQLTNLEITDTDQQLMDKKVDRLTKLLSPPYVTDIRLMRDSHHNKGEIITCIINVEHGKHVFHAERTAETAQDALDECLAAMHKELAKNRDKEIEASRIRKRPV